MKRFMRKIAASFLAFSMLFNANLPTVIVAEDGTEETAGETMSADTEQPEEIQEPEQPEEPSEPQDPAVIEEPVVTGETVPSEETVQPDEVQEVHAETETPEEQYATGEDQVTEASGEVEEEEGEPETVYTVVGVFAADDGTSSEQVFELGEDAVPVSELAPEIDGYTWNGSAVLTNADGNAQQVASLSKTGYTMNAEDGTAYSVLYSDVFGAEDQTIYVVFAYTLIQPELPEPEEEPEYEYSFRFENDRVVVRAEAHDGAEIPAGAELCADYLVPGSAAYNTAAEAILKDTGSVPDKTVEFELYDIYFTSDGERIEPNDNVDISLQFKQPVTPAAENATIGEAEVVHVDSSNNAEVVSEQNIVATEGGIEAISFTNDSFSPYGVKFTVDYTYDGYTWSMTGGTEIYLSELFSQLGIPVSAADAAAIDFTNYELLSFTQIEGNWIIRSLKPFDSQETLTVSMTNGDKYVIDVKDEQSITTNMRDLLTGAVIEGVTDNTVKPGTEYSVAITLKETANLQLDPDNTLYYDLPAGMVVLHDQTIPISIVITSGGVEYTVPATLTATTDGKLHIDVDKTSEYFGLYKSTRNVQLIARFQASFDGSETEIHFSDTVTKAITIDTDDGARAYVQKNGTYDAENGKFNYTITVTSSGITRNVNIKDIITGNALNFNNDVQISSNRGTVPPYTVNTSESSAFDYTFETLQDGEVLTITYSADVDFAKDTNKDGKIDYDQTGNTVTVKPEDKPENKSNYSQEIVYSTIDKSGGKVTGTPTVGDKTVYEQSWSVVVNPEAVVPMGGTSFTDTVKTDAGTPIWYSGTGPTIYVYDKGGALIDTRTPTWAEVNCTASSIEGASGQAGFTYSIPSTDTQAYKYVIEYTTQTDASEKIGAGTPVNVTNTGHSEYGSSSETGKIGGDDPVTITKNAEEFDGDYVTWKSVIHVPETGLSTAVVTDNLPWRKLQDEGWAIGDDEYVENSLDIDGTLDGETYEVEYITNSNPQDDGPYKQIKITFYKDTGKTQTGLQGTPGGHDIIITLKTIINEKWREHAIQYGSYWQTHKNKIDINGTTATASVEVSKPDISKENKGKTEEDVDGDSVKDTVFHYDIIIKNHYSDSLTVDDFFDTSVFELLTDVSYFRNTTNDLGMVIYAGDQYNQLQNPVRVNYSDIDGGVRFSSSTLPKLKDGSKASWYRICYYLKLKDGKDLNLIAGQNGGHYDVSNTAKYGEKEYATHYDVVYKPLSKELTKEPNPDLKDRTAGYRITYNAAGAMLNNGQSVEMTDILSKELSLDYTSVAVTTVPDGAEVPYVIGGTSDGGTQIVFTVPDATAVTVTYNAMVVGSGNVTYTNTVSVGDEHASVTDTKNMSIEGGGSGALADLKVVKVDGYNGGIKLAGVKFKLYASDHRNLSKDTANPVYEVELTTDSNGVIHIDGNELTIDYGVKYCLEEISTLPNYRKLDVIYQFTLADDISDVNYKNYIYFYNDTFQIKNYPGTDIEVIKTWSDGNDKHADDTVTVKLQQKVGEGDWSDTIRNEVKEGSSYVWRDQSLTAQLSEGTDWKAEFNGLTLSVPVDPDNLDEGFSDVQYRVVETLVNNRVPSENTISYSETASGGKKVIEITNTVGKGNLTITKTFAGNTDKLTDADKAKISFTVSGPEWSEAQTFTYAQMDAGVKTYENIKLGDYTVTETIGEGKTYKTTYKVGSERETEGTTTGAQTLTTDGLTIAFTNTYLETEQKLKIEKVIEAAQGVSVPGPTFHFTLSANDGVPMPTGGTEVTINGSGSAEFGAIKYTSTGTYKYTITETESGSKGGWTYNTGGAVTATVTVSADESTGALSASVNYDKPNNDKTAGLITNKYEEGKLKVVKTAQLNGETDPGAEGKTFKVGIYESETTTEAKEVKEITIGNDGTGYVIFDKLTVGRTYYVYEMEGDNKAGTKVGEYTVVTGSGSGAAVAASTTDDKTTTIALVNNKELGNLSVKKTVTGAPSTASGKTFKIAVKDKSGNYYKQDGSSAGKTPEYVEIGDRGTAEWNNLLAGTYTVEEKTDDAQIEDYTLSVSGTGTVNVEAGKTANAEVINTYTGGKGYLKITKVFGEDSALRDKDLTDEQKDAICFIIKDQAGIEIFGSPVKYRSFTDGSWTSGKLALGEYEITEEVDVTAFENYGLTTVYEPGTQKVTVTEDRTASAPALITVTNTYTEDTGKLKITKLVSGAPEDASDKQYRIAVRNADGKYYAKDGSTVEKASAWVLFRANDEVTWENLPVGTYTAEEDTDDAAVDGYKLEVSEAVNVTVEKDGEASAEITNTYTREEGSLKVTKTVKSDDGNDKKTEFSFKVTLDDKTISGTFGDMTFKDGAAEFTLKDGETKTASGLPAGVKYTVEEEKVTGFTVTKTGDTGTIEADKTVEASFTNAKETTPTPTPTPTATPKPTPTPTPATRMETRQVNVVKVWKDGNDAGRNRPANVTVHLLADGVDTGLTVQLNAANNWNYVWYDLPVYSSYGNIISYSVAEDPAAGYTAEYSGSMNGGYVITNKKRVIPKTDDTFEALKLQAVLLGSMLMAMLSSLLLRKTAKEG